MTFGQTIKALRKEANITQEKLAEFLSISPQAVSRWETDVAMPDISLLPPLANLFHVTTDHLLGMETYQKDLRKAEFDEAFHKYWEYDDKEKNYQIALRAVTEYPGNLEYVEWLASAEYYVALPTSDNSKYTRLLENSAKHYKLVLDNTKDAKLYSKALSGIVLALSSNQKKDEAKQYAMLEEDEEKRDELLCWCLEGEERKKHCQHLTNTKLNSFLYQLQFGQDSIEVCDAVEKILNIMFPDGNFQYYHNTLQYNSISKAFLFCQTQQYDCVLEELKKARYHAVEMTKINHQRIIKFTAPLFSLVEEELPVTDSDATDVDNYIRCLNNNRCFDPIRETEDFKALIVP
ncbi:MAG: helix-turn-helix transcriptional regulator [Clostridia bacterium]|nr:helix-turn-helix transcriptional regulator [Clostridia bacterium]